MPKTSSSISNSLIELMSDSLDEYQIQETLGEGSYGQVFLATGPDGPVAVKMLRGDRMTRQMQGRFQLECEALARAKGHPNIVEPRTKLREAKDGSLYIVLEYVPGGTLGVCLAESSLKPDQVLKISLGLTRALVRVHELGYLHRDFCTGNILLTANFKMSCDLFLLAKLNGLVSLIPPG